MSLGLTKLLCAVAVAGLFFASIRSAMVGDIFGILAWPVSCGFGVDRLRGGNGIAGGTAGGLGAALALASLFLPMASLLASFPVNVSLALILTGLCWGYYLSVWIYIAVETILHSL